MGGITTTLFQRPRDPNFNQTTLLLSGNFPTNGAQNNTFLDSSSNGFTITRNPSTGPNAPTQGTFSPFSQTGWSNFFGASGSYAQTTNTIIATTTTTFTIEGWIYPTATPVTGSSIPSVIVDGAPTGAQLYWGFGPLANGTLSFYWYDGVAKSAVGNTVIALNTWTHIAVSVNANAITLYVNGVQQTLTGTTTLTNRNGTTGITAFAQFNTGGSYFTGYISNFSILSGTAKYSTSFTPSPAPLPTGTTNQVLLFAYANNFVDSNTATTAKTFTITGTPSVQAFSPFAPSGAYTTTAVGGSGYFDGMGDYLTVTGNAAFALGAGDYCAEAWIYITGAQTTNFGWGVFGTYPGSGTNGWSITVNRSGNNTSVIWIIGGSIITSVGTPYLPVNAWTHIAVTRSGSSTNNTKIFINGAVSAQVTDNTNDTFTGTLYVGGQGAGQLFPGYISGTRFVKGSPVYTAAFTPATAPPTPIANTSILLNFTNAGIVDSTAKNVLETVGNAQISTTQSRFGGSSMLFDGTAPADYLRIPSSPITSLGSGSWTIEFWVYRVGSGNQIFYDQRSQATQIAVTIFNDGTNILRFYVNGANVISDTTTFPLTTWTHVAVCKSGSSTRMFVNGTQVGSTYADTNTYVNNPIFIGSQFDSTGLFNGYIDDLRVTLFGRYTANFNVPTIGFTDR